MKEEKFKNNILWYNFTLCILVVCIHAQNMHIFIEPVAWINHAISFWLRELRVWQFRDFLCVQDICFIGI